MVVQEVLGSVQHHRPVLNDTERLIPGAAAVGGPRRAGNRAERLRGAREPALGALGEEAAHTLPGGLQVLSIGDGVVLS